MRIEQSLVSAWASRLSNKAIQEAIDRLRKINSNDLLSGDSGLKDTWEEICVQVQGEESAFWESYLETIDQVFEGVFFDLSREEKLAMWTSTDEGWDWVHDHYDESDGEDVAPYDQEAVIKKLREELLFVAGAFESPAICRYLQRHEDGYDEIDEEEDDEEGEDDEDSDNDQESDDNITETRVQQSPFSGAESSSLRLRHAVQDPIVLVVSREQIESSNIHEVLQFLKALVPIDDPSHAWSMKGRVSLVITGYDRDERELYEIPEVCDYLRLIDQEWPFWFFFLNQVDESIKVLAMCLGKASKVAPGLIRFDPIAWSGFMERSFTAVNYLFETYGFPEAENESLSEGIMQVFENAQRS